MKTKQRRQPACRPGGTAPAPSAGRVLRGVALSALVMMGATACEDQDLPRGDRLPTSPAAARGQASGKIANQFVVVLKPGQSARARAAEIAAAHGGQVMHVYGAALNGFSVRLPEAARSGLERNPNVAFVEPDFVVTAQVQTIPTGIDHVEADGNGFAKIDGIDDLLDVDIAILDSGIDVDHPDLRLGGAFKNCIGGASDDLYGHGTHVAGIAAARDNGDGVVGVAPGARLWPVKVLDDYGTGTLSSVLCGIDHVTANAAQIEVANMSFGAGMFSDALRAAVKASVDAGVFLAAAAGNSRVDLYGPDLTFNTSDDFVPAAYPEVAAVSALADSDGKSGGAGNGFAICGTAIQMDDAFACFSNFSQSVAAGNPVTSSGGAIDLAAPGVAILSTYPGGGTRTMDGTSMASPHVAGAAALYVREKGTRDVNRDGQVNGADVALIRQALIDRSTDQSAWRADGQTSDRDANQERGLQVATATSGPTEPSPAPVAPSTTPDGGTLTVTEGTTGNASLFTIRNNGSASESFSLSCQVAGQVSACSAPPSVTVAAGGTSEVTVSFSAGTAGSGAVSMSATGDGGSDSGSYDVTVEAAPATPAPSPAAVAHVHSVTVSSAFKAQSIEPQGMVVINDAGELPVKEARVVVDWYHNGVLVGDDLSATTNGSGEARLRGPRMKARAGDAVKLCVVKVVHAGYTYDGASNHESCDGFNVSKSQGK